MLTQDIAGESVRILVTTRDSVQATVFRPYAEITGVLIIHPATATPQGFYRAFAQSAASRGLLTITYDYRGTGLSGSPKDQPEIKMRDWIQQDIPAVGKWASERYPNLPHYAIGHSVGGHGLIMNYGTDNLKAFTIISSHMAALRTVEPMTERIKLIMILNVLGPVMSRVLGYMPERKLGLGEDITRSAMLDWSSWTLRKNYFFDDPSMRASQRAAQVKIPVLAIGASDDLWAAPKPMDLLTKHITGAPVERRTYTPGELGAKKVGHHGLMKRGVGEPVWEDILDWFTR
ncbi:serine aminopeptidase domain-containing protein [Glutamicibacter sp. JC586]|uniref:alpha/beta hydrolase family protein n=1 Tax=Glutamicibacter sp. JC586 TaxID=2590552 RepID=UPI001356E38F|nr:alpha/beta hydrolase [Glutamicibacter sp. JC586]